MKCQTEFIELTCGDRTGFNSLYAIYQQSIPATERKSPASLEAMLARHDYRFFAGLSKAGQVHSFAVLYIGEAATLLEYLAVEEAHRGNGVGAALFQHCAVLGNGPMLVEIESPDGEGSNQLVRLRRMDFYRRLGCRVIQGLGYRLPLSLETPPMRLLVHGLADRDALSVEEVKAFLTTLYTRVYDKSADDARIAEMLDGLRNPVLLK